MRHKIKKNKKFENNIYMHPDLTQQLFKFKARTGT